MSDPIRCERFGTTMTQKACDNYRFFNPEKCAGCPRNATPPAREPADEVRQCTKGCPRPVFAGGLCKSCYNAASARKVREQRKAAGVKEVGRKGATITLHVHVANATDVPDLLERLKAAVESLPSCGPQAPRPAGA